MGSQTLLIDGHSTHGKAHPLYPMKVWLTALFLVAPCCLWLKKGIVYADFGIGIQDLGLVILLGMSGLILSLPVYGVLFLTFQFLKSSRLPVVPHIIAVKIRPFMAI